MSSILWDGEKQKTAKSPFLLDLLVTIVLIAVDIIAIVVVGAVFQLGNM